MNQILQTENKKSGGPIEIKKIIIFFAIAIIIFGLILLIQGSYAMLVGTKENENNEPQVVETQPQVDIQKTDENILISITHNKAIKSVKYYWNDGEEQSIETNNQMSIQEQISLPFGENTLNLTVVDEDGNESNYSKEYTLDGDGKPVIELLLTNENKIHIKAQDLQGLKYIRYTWNNGNWKTINANIEDLKLIDELAEIPLGQNTLRVEAVNTNDMITTKELEVKGVRRPTVSLRQEGNSLIIRAEDEVEMKVINFTLNGQKYQINCSGQKVVEQKMQDLPQGESRIELKAENKEGGITEVNGICNVQ